MRDGSRNFGKGARNWQFRKKLPGKGIGAQGQVLYCCRKQFQNCQQNGGTEALVPQNAQNI